MEDEKPIERTETSKNKWLYTNDDLGKLEKDMVSEDKVYKSGIQEAKTDGFKIIIKKKK